MEARNDPNHLEASLASPMGLGNPKTVGSSEYPPRYTYTKGGQVGNVAETMLGGVFKTTPPTVSALFPDLTFLVGLETMEILPGVVLSPRRIRLRLSPGLR
jgi:hypothetical protein